MYIVNETYLDTVADQFNVQGELKVDRETIILSSQLVSQINETIGVSLEIGSYFNFSIAGSAPQQREPDCTRCLQLRRCDCPQWRVLRLRSCRRNVRW